MGHRRRDLHPRVLRLFRDIRRARAWRQYAAEARTLGRVEGWRRPPALKPGPTTPTIVASWSGGSEYVIDCPDARTPAWWRARLPLGVTFRLDLHPAGTGDAAGLRRRLDLGTWSGLELPAVPIGAPASEILLDAPTGRTAAALSSAAAKDGRPIYSLPATTWSKLAPERAAKVPAKIRARLLGGRELVLDAGGVAPDALQVYVERRR